MAEKATTSQKIRRVILGLAGLALFASLVFDTMLASMFINYPRVPNPEIGRVFPHELKGIVVYVTDRQSRILTALWWTQIGSGSVILISLFLNQKWPLQKKE